MKKTPNRWYTSIAVIVLLALTGFLAWGVVKIWLLFWDYITRSTPEVGAAIIAGSFTLLVSVFSVVLTRWIERNKEFVQRQWQLEQEIRKEHLPIYQTLVEFIIRILTGSKTGNPLTPDEVQDFFINFTQKILVWGSDRFLKDFSAFRESTELYAEQAKSGGDNTEALKATMLSLEKLLYRIRADYGHGNKGLKEGDLLTYFITDIRNYIPKSQAGSHN